MGGWIHLNVAVVAASLGCVSTLLLVFMWRLCHHKKEHRDFAEPKSLTRMESLQAGITKLHHHHHHHQPTTYHQFDHANKNKGNFYVLQNGVNGRKHLFNWADHPHLVVDAVENGWSRFAFANYKSNIPSQSKRSTLFGVCASGEYGREFEAEISWEVCQGSAEYMQKVRLNPGLRKVLHSNNSSMSVYSVIRAVLPLPGPALGNHAFPQEAYFEITILCCRVSDHESGGKREGEKTKLLIGDSSNGKDDLDIVEERKVEGGGKSGSVMLSLGLTAEEVVPLRVPGSYPKSIGFNSNGSVFLEGMKLVMESEKAQWVGSDRVIGCGFDPNQKKVFFTLDSELVHVIHCQSEEFGTPLWPTLAANIDIQVLVNFGQSAFKYAPANAQRTPNPCFIAPLVSSPGATLGYDDSKELFSMGRIDSQWLNPSSTKGNHNNNNNNNLAFDFDEESEADLFEIILDGSEKSPKAPSQFTTIVA